MVPFNNELGLKLSGFFVVRLLLCLLGVVGVSLQCVTAVVVSFPGLLEFGGFFTVTFENQCIYASIDSTGDFLTAVVSPVPNVIIGCCGVVVLVKTFELSRAQWHSGQNKLPERVRA